MTEFRCWVSYNSDRPLQLKVKNGWYGDKDSAYLPISDFPVRIGADWPSLLSKWSKQRGIELSIEDALTLRAKVKKKQIADFIEYVYGADPSYNDPAEMLTWKGRAYLANRLTDLRAFVAQELNPRLWYKLNADEF
jgi:hypothetical protein